MPAKVMRYEKMDDLIKRAEIIDFDLEHKYSTIVTEISAIMQLIDGIEMDVTYEVRSSYLRDSLLMVLILESG
jgi:hypothetical protein